ncbi:MAG: DsbC family protein [Pseudomonadota bacterium]
MTPFTRTKTCILGLTLALFNFAGWAKEATPAPAVANPVQALEQVSTQAKGFTVGSAASANTVYVMFDAQCSHCGHLWKNMQPLLGKAKFVWIPVAILNTKSGPQGAAILGASNPEQAMVAHEASLMAGKGGVITMGSMPPPMVTALKGNTELFSQLKVESVPFILAKNARTGEVVSTMGALETRALAGFIGVDAN